MAKVGEQLLQPEVGWRRYDDTDSRIQYNVTNLEGDPRGYSSSYYGGSCYYLPSVNDTCIIKFFGSKFRLIDALSVNGSVTNISIDGGINDSYNGKGPSTIPQTICYEKQDLPLGIHTVIITSLGKNITSIDAIDIDDTGYLIHPTLNQISDINTMKIGDCIPCRYTAKTSGQAGTFSELGTCIANEIPITGTATPDGLFYFIKVDKGTLIADRVIQKNISWDALNSAKYIEGHSLANSPKGTASASSSASSDYAAWMAFDGNTSTHWSSDHATSGTLSYDFGINMSVGSYMITPEQNVTTAPTTWTFEGWNGVSWTVLDTRTNITNWVARVGQIFNIEGTNNTYSKFRLNISATENTLIRIAEFEIIKANKAKGVIRSLSGGCAYADEKGNLSFTDKKLGAWPINNEWDKYILNSDLKGKIIKGDDKIWNYNVSPSWCKETPINGRWYTTSDYGVDIKEERRIIRGMNTASSWENINYEKSTDASYEGFRPVLNYVEDDIKDKFIY